MKTEFMTKKLKFGYGSLAIMLVAGIAIGSYAFPQKVTDKDVVNQTVATYDIKNIRIEGRCYDTFGDKIGEAKNTRSAIHFSNDKERMRGNIGWVIFRNPLEDIEADNIECPENTTDMELLIKSVGYKYEVHQAGTMIDNGSATAQIFQYVDAHKREEGHWELESSSTEDEIMQAIIEDQPW